MKNYLYVLIILLVNINLIAQDKMTTVDSVDLKKYTGTWYEIAKIPNRFQDHCIKNATASYTIDEDGDIIVHNKCIDEDGELDDAEGLARVVDKETNSKLEVSFVSFLGWRPFWGDYWILGLESNYQYVVIGTPSREFGWILCRTPQMSEADLENCYKIFEKNGYDRKSFELSKQD
ncbi:MAG: hypothetical protein CR986_06295 [Ignavibacteriae bacterium]|nr:MAG: hypothetical protein CR986_06295 [Ignavibacteriota bacterium]